MDAEQERPHPRPSPGQLWRAIQRRTTDTEHNKLYTIVAVLDNSYDEVDVLCLGERCTWTMSGMVDDVLVQDVA